MLISDLKNRRSKEGRKCTRRHKKGHEGQAALLVPAQGDLMDGRRNEVEMSDLEAPNVIFSLGSLSVVVFDKESGGFGL